MSEDTLRDLSPRFGRAANSSPVDRGSEVVREFVPSSSFLILYNSHLY